MGLRVLKRSNVFTYSAPKSSVTSSPISTKGAQYFTALNFVDSRRNFIARLRDAGASPFTQVSVEDFHKHHSGLVIYCPERR